MPRAQPRADVAADRRRALPRAQPTSGAPTSAAECGTNVPADGRSRAYVNDQPAGVAALREIGSRLVEVHGQHETVGLLDWRTHRSLLDAYGGLSPQLSAVAAAGETLKAAEAHLAGLQAAAAEHRVLARRHGFVKGTRASASASADALCWHGTAKRGNSADFSDS